MLKKLATVTLGVAAGLVAVAPLASAQEAPTTTSEAGTTETSSSSPAIQAPVADGSLAGVLEQSNVGVDNGNDVGGAHALSGNGPSTSGHDLSA